MRKVIYTLFCVSLFLSCKKEPVANFSFPSSSDVSNTVVFTNLSSHSNSYFWDFGDGENSTDESPSHRYKMVGSYTVGLKATGKGGISTEYKSIRITGITYSFLNRTTFRLADFCSFYWDGSKILDLVEYGPLNPYVKTSSIITRRNSMYFGFTSGNYSYICAEPYKLTLNQNNSLNIDDNTKVYRSTGKSNNIDDETSRKIFDKFQEYLKMKKQ